MPTGAPPQARRRFLPPPVWRFAPRRLLHDVVTLTLMFGVLTMLAVAAAAGPLYAEAVSDAAVRLALESVPAGSSAKTAPVVRLNGGIDPESRPWTDMLRSLEEIPGVGPARVTTQTISTELHPKLFFDPVGPVVSGERGSAPVRLFGVDDPAARLVVLTRATGAGEGVWLPDPVARSTGVAAGDEVQVRLSGLPEAPATTTRVLGTYAVQADGRTPQSPAGEQLWADLGIEAFPSDAQEQTRRPTSPSPTSPRPPPSRSRPATSCCGPPRPRLTDPPRAWPGSTARRMPSASFAGSSPRARRWPTARWPCAPRS